MKKIIKTYFLRLKSFRILDWVVIFTIFCIAIFLIALSLNQNQWVSIEFKVVVTPSNFPFSGGDTPPIWIADKIKIGDFQYDNLGKQNLRIEDIKSWGVGYKETWVTASVRAKYKPQQKKYTFQYQPLEVGRPIDVTINGTNIHGVVTYINGVSDTRKTYDITVKTRILEEGSPYSVVTRGVDSWIADALEKDMIMKDPNGNMIAKIIEKDVRPAERVITTNEGRVFLGADPLKKDIFLTLQLKVTKQNNTYFFLEDKPIMIDYTFPMLLEKILIYPTITEIIMLPESSE